MRHAFEGDYLPHEILWREKAALRDAVGHSMVDYLKAYAEEKYTEEEFQEKARKYTHAVPFTKKNPCCIGKFLKNIIPVREK